MTKNTGKKDTGDGEVIKLRREKIEQLRARGVEPYGGAFQPDVKLSSLREEFTALEPGEESGRLVKAAGRLTAKRRHGKASFMVLKDDSGDIQLYLSLNNLGEDGYHELLDYDIGDIIGVGGEVFRTRRGELSINVREFKLLGKSARPLPEKWHGLKDKELRYRQRYLDLIVNPQVKEVFIKRNKIIKSIRAFLDERDFMEVETPMLQPIPGGAAARPFMTHHNALGIDLYLRIAPELYLKRLLVGGFERVYELNRSFRNEGISIKHNPEFTMLEVYQAYADYRGMMRLAEDIIKAAAAVAVGGGNLEYQGETLNFTQSWPSLSMTEALAEVAGVRADYEMEREELAAAARRADIEIPPHYGKGKIITELYEKLVEPKLIQPTFITDYPKEITPLAKSNPENEYLVERFELIIAGREVANAFSELTDPAEQQRRFAAQAALRSRGDEEAQFMDKDYVRALEYGMPPAGGLGIGIDRLVMILTNSPSIRDVIFFPQLRPEGGK